MVQIDAAIIGVIFTVLTTLLAMAFGYGQLTTRVKFNKDNVETLFDKFSKYQAENREDHDRILNRIDKMSNHRNA